VVQRRPARKAVTCVGRPVRTLSSLGVRQFLTWLLMGSLIFMLDAGMVCAQTVSNSLSAPEQTIGGSSSVLAEIIVTGTRESGITVANSAAPVQILSAAALKTAAGNPTLMTALAQTVPSFTQQGFGNDMAAQTLQAKLRGLSCNDVLVLVNGKRRHGTANIEVDSGPFQGCAGVDLGFIPLDAVDHIEVLKDGAAAQYGSDAIAGVINIILKTNSSGGTVSGTYGGYKDGGGDTGEVSANAGFQPIPGSYLNVTAESDHHGSSNRSGIDEQVLNPANLDTYPGSNMPQAPGYPYLGAEEGDAQYDLKLLELNAGFNFDHSIEFS
jgi:iron complex outermembrane receptor protein